MSLIIDALRTAGAAQAEVLTIMGAGIVASHKGLLQPTNLPVVSKLCLSLLQPCLIFSLNQSFTLARVLSWSPVLFVSCLHMLMGAALGHLASRAMGLRSPRRELITLTTAFGNCGALPFVLLPPIIRSWPVTRDDPSSEETGMAVIGLYLFMWFVVFFSCGIAYASCISPTQRRPLAAADAASTAPAMDSTDGMRLAAPSCSHDSEEPAIAVEEAASGSNGLLETSPVAPLANAAAQHARTARWHQLRGALSAVNPAVYMMVGSVVLGCIPWLHAALDPSEGGGLLGWLGSAVRGSDGTQSALMSSVLHSEALTEPNLP